MTFRELNALTGRLLPITALLLLIVQGCTVESSLVRQELDPLTSVTISYISTPLVFYREASGRAAHARDFVYMAPLEINRSGDYRYFLWLGIWTTMGGAPVNQSRDGFETIVVFVDGEPLPLDVAGWTAAAVGASESVYPRPVASAADAYYAVTVDQIRVIQEAREIRLQATGPRNRDYEPWDDQNAAKRAMREFLARAFF